MNLSRLSSATDVAQVIKDEDGALKALMESGVIAFQRSCKKCGKPMKLRRRKETYEFRCRLNKKQDCSTEGVRIGSWFEKTRIPLKDAVLLIVLWTQNYSSQQIVKETGLSPSTVVDFRNFLRNACSDIRSSYPPLGGPGKTIQVDESAIHTRKYGRGSKDRELTWVIGGIESGTRNCFLQIVPNRTKSILIPILRREIDSMSTVWTDSFKSYGSIKKFFSHHESVNHSVEFTKKAADGSVIHTNAIESLWKRMKDPLKHGNGTSEMLLASYLDEIVVRERESDNFSAKIWDYIRDFQ